MSTLIQSTLTAQENLIALLKVKTPELVVEVADFVTDAPEAQVGDRNTKLVLTATDSGRFTDASTTEITYDRLPVESGVLDAEVSYVLGEEETLEELLARIVTAINAVPGEVVFAAGTVLPAVGETEILTLEAVQDSLLYVGDFDVTVEAPDAPVVTEDIGDVIYGEQEGFAPVTV